ncbi:hypothetical protein VZG47_01470 [Synechococcus elongatus IITB5]|uniref:hypothetical protein n=1 Tax=Synechococcus elongatus TaxID=32046 RepID=UPI0030D1DC9F
MMKNQPSYHPRIVGFKYFLLPVASLSLLTLATASESRADALLESSDAQPKLISTEVQESPQTESPQSVTNDSESSEAWKFSIEPYVFAPLRVQGPITVRGVTANIDAGLGQVLEALSFAAAARARLEKDQFALFTDLYYVDLKGSGLRSINVLEGPRGRTRAINAATTVNTSQGIYDFAAQYRFGSDRPDPNGGLVLSVSPYVGVRVVDVATSLDLQVSSTSRTGRREISSQRFLSASQTKVQPLLGSELKLIVTPEFSLFARGDIGGLGLGSGENLSANGIVGAAIKIGNSTNLNLAYRTLRLNLGNTDASPNSFDITQTGLQLGLQIRF